MKFSIRRTSTWTDERPCDEATQEIVVLVDERTVDDPKKLNGIGTPQEWVEHGKNHRVENGHIKRDLERIGWTVKLNSLKDLVEFSKKYGELIISESPSIEIYDDYRE